MATFLSDMIRNVLYIKVVKSSLIISIVSSKRRPFSFITAVICLNNMIDLDV